ncbi:MAG: TetR/AcrR family transcriptional regulator [Halieaceae bacterium]|nr:TetR/AcrR family transcriptional regulator [Halieaceae bacterium]
MSEKNKEGWQAEKSSRTRVAILEGAIKCYAELGYSKTTASTIVANANVSRGAMAHHFKSLADVVHSCAVYIKDRRIAQFAEIVEQMSSEKKHTSRVRALEAYWSWLQTDYAYAYYELLNVSRTQGDLKKVIIPIKAAFEDTTRELFVNYFPALNDKAEILAVTQDIIQHVFDGMFLDAQLERPKKLPPNVLVFIDRWLDRLWEDYD